MEHRLDLKCDYCGYMGLECVDGFYYCEQCYAQADGVTHTAFGIDETPMTQEQAKGSVRRAKPVVKEETKTVKYEEIRNRYVMGVQILIELQIKALVEELQVCPVIVGMIEPVWLRFLASTKLFSDDWAKTVQGEIEGDGLKAKREAELHKEDGNAKREAELHKEDGNAKREAKLHKVDGNGKREAELHKVDGNGKCEAENHKVGGNAKSETKHHKVDGKAKREEAKRHKGYGKRCVTILSKTIPLSHSLVISFLACHLAREPILSTDIIKWALEGKLPYFAAFDEINRQLVEIGEHLVEIDKQCASRMFRPIQVISAQKLESLAASVAKSVGLELPPVNFYAIASRYLKQLSLPVNLILPHACLIYDWSMPPELWLSANEFKLPTHASVLSILIVSIRILYNIHGFGKWEMSLSQPCSSQSDIDDFAAADPCNKQSEQSNLDATEILVLLQSKYNELIDTSDHAKDLETYLKFCKKVVFAGVESSLEEAIIESLWDFYSKQEDHKTSESCLSPSSPHKRPRNHSQSNMNKTKKPKNDNVQMTLDHKESYKDREIRRMKSSMEENKFCYIPPRKRVKRHDYLHYTRKKGDGAYVYAAHADYYILLRSCAQVAQLDVRSMHAAVLSFERRLDYLEKNIQHSLKQMPRYEACEHCHDGVSMDLSKLNL